MAADIQIPSNLDMVILSLELEERFKDLAGMHLRMKGYALPISDSMKSAIYHWRCMMVRMNAVVGKARKNPEMEKIARSNPEDLIKMMIQQKAITHTESEKIAVREVAQWTVDVHCELRNQPKKILEWVD